MKIRSGYVSNSSSSSFIILLEDITDEQKQMIYDHIRIGMEVDNNLKQKGLEPIYEWYEEWNLKEDDFSLWAYTFMDNFQLKDFIAWEVKIPYEKMIPFGDGYYWGNNDLYECREYQQLKRSKKLNKINKKVKK